MLQTLTSRTYPSIRFFNSTAVIKSSSLTLKEALENVIPQKRNTVKELKSTYGGTVVGPITISSVLGGMRGNQSMFWQGTSLDPEHGIRFQDLTIEQCQKRLPNTGVDGDNFLPESMLWLLMTGSVPTFEQTGSLRRELAIRGRKLPHYTEKVLLSLPKDMHPMTQLAIGLASMNKGSIFAKNYQKGLIGKNDFWKDTLEDSLNLIASLPLLTGRIYSNITNEGHPLGEYSEHVDWCTNICSLLGMTNGRSSSNTCNLNSQQSLDFINLMRLYTGIHVDHEGGNVSAHTTHLVGSALSDPYLSYSSGIMGLAGPLHGLAAQEVVRFLIEMNSNISSTEQEEEIKNYLWKVLNSNRVIPGYGHAVLRKPDPRFTAMLEFAQKRPTEFKDDENVLLMQKLSEIAPKVLLEHGKSKNPFPNVDSASGILFYHYGIRELLFFTVIFGCSRAIGPLTQLVWDRILGLPIERPKSLNFEGLQALTNNDN
ncbi:Cit3p [Saccharomyces cerevisiae x Saccharomyces kudriavzevii VIN7]|uniref:Citrate synthase n=1 Tax=Saccharomyces cerevisiae x Saccharomyces kudriavzevii (strain VIN7) TaxID=1095631 RepID=H0H282_SACCK|nr:Cit3p [Saccharomyces cerevisiae x Saccharomyces kudriavzevii VIN7]